ncbi:MAG TPA: ferritin-like domain-containing protein [Solirubrobacteraceae bacterium]|nr:ferritin-like domain-containing protein [Solirubrobacteraceae bacterium]
MLTLTRSASDAPTTDRVGPRSAVVSELIAAYWHEIETVSDHVASSTNRDGISGERIARSVRETVASDLEHAQRVAVRIRRLHAPAPSRDEFVTRQPSLRPPAEPLDNASLLSGLIEAETAATKRYRRVAAAASEAHDSVTQDLAKRIIREKEIRCQSLGSLLPNDQRS